MKLTIEQNQPRATFSLEQQSVFAAALNQLRLVRDIDDGGRKAFEAMDKFLERVDASGRLWCEKSTGSVD